MISPDILEATGPVIRSFTALGVEYYIGGSIASSAYGMPRSTLDVDLVADLGTAQMDRFIKALGDAYYFDRDLILKAIESKASFNLIHLQTMLKLDVFIRKDTKYDTKMFDRRRLEYLDELDGTEPFYLASAEDVLLHKLMWYRMGGEVSERQWGDVLGIIRVQGLNLDSSYLHHWAAVLGIADLLDRALHESEGVQSPGKNR